MPKYVSYQLLDVTEEGRRGQRPICCDYNNQDEKNTNWNKYIDVRLSVSDYVGPLGCLFNPCLGRDFMAYTASMLSGS